MDSRITGSTTVNEGNHYIDISFELIQPMVHSESSNKTLFSYISELHVHETRITNQQKPAVVREMLPSQTNTAYLFCHKSLWAIGYRNIRINIKPSQGAGVVNGFACYLSETSCFGNTVKRMSSDAQVRILSLTIPFTFLYGFPTN